MIDDVKFAQRWNQVSPECTADMLGFLFRTIRAPADAAKHDLVLDFILKRMNENDLPKFFCDVAKLIERYSLESMNNGQTQEN